MGGVVGGSGAPNLVLAISSTWVEIRLHARFQLPRLPGSGSCIVGEAKNKTKNKTTR